MLQKLVIGDEVAIIPAAGAPADTTSEIATIGYAGVGFIQLADGRMYSSTDGRCMGSSHGGYAVIPTTAHRKAAVKNV